MKFIYSILFVLFCLQWVVAQDKDIPPRPNPPQLVNDLTRNTLDAQEEGNLEIRLRKLNDTTSSQVAVVIVSSLNGYDVADYAIRLAKKWGIGQKGKNNGVLLLFAMTEHKSTIQVGYGLEGALTDLETQQILVDVIRPYFKQQKYYEGIDNGITAIAQAIAGEYKSNGSDAEDGGDWLVFVVVIFFIVIFLISAFSRRSRGGYRGGGGSPFIFFDGGGSSGGYDSDGGGSSFDFGGGDFGGGGSSSDW